VTEVRALRDSVAAGRWPVVGISAGVAERRQSENGPIPIDQIPGLDRDQTIYETGFDAAWEFSLAGGTRRAVEAADARLTAALEQQRGAQMRVAAETARSYFELRGAQHERDAVRAGVEASRASTDLVRRQLAAGEVSEASLARAEASLAAVESSLPLLDAAGPGRGAVDRGSARRSARVRSRSCTNAGGLRCAEVTSGRAAGGPVAAPARCACGRARTGCGHGPRSASRRPSCFRKSVSAQMRAFSLWPAEICSRSASETFLLAPVISWQIFSGGRVRATIRANEARVEIAALEYEKAVKTALSDAERALTRYRLGLAALERQRAAVAAARRSYGFSGERYRAGDISLLELLAAEQGFAKRSRLRAHAHRGCDRLVALYKALGGGWPASDDERQRGAR
jgi:outer membrane protein TolC